MKSVARVITSVFVDHSRSHAGSAPVSNAPELLRNLRAVVIKEPRGDFPFLIN